MSLRLLLHLSKSWGGKATLLTHPSAPPLSAPPSASPTVQPGKTTPLQPSCPAPSNSQCTSEASGCLRTPLPYMQSLLHHHLMSPNLGRNGRVFWSVGQPGTVESISFIKHKCKHSHLLSVCGVPGTVLRFCNILCNKKLISLFLKSHHNSTRSVLSLCPLLRRGT